MSKKEYIGITYDEEFLRIAKVRLNNKKHPVLVSTETIELSKPLDSTEIPKVETLDAIDENDIFSPDSNFETTGQSQEQDDFDILTSFTDLQDDEPETTEEVDDDDPFNLASEESEVSESKEKRSTELLLTEYFDKCRAKQLITGLHIPFGKTSFQLLKGVNPAAMKKRDRHEYFAEKLRPIHAAEIEKDQYAWIQLEPTKSILAFTHESFELISLAESVQEYTDKKVVLKQRLPDESIWAGLLRYNYDPADDEITGLVAIGKSSSRVIFMKGSQIISILPIITEGEESSIVLNTIYSKILFELDKGDIPGINRLLIVQTAAMGEMAKVYFQRQFSNTEVDLLSLDQNKVVLTDPSRQTPSHLQPYMTAIGAAFAAADVQPEHFSDFSLLPNYIKEKQQLYRIEWHGAIILILIGLTPLFLNHLYKKKSNELYQIQNEITMTEIQMESLRPLAELTENYQFQTNFLNRENEYILDLSQYSHEWSDVMQILNNGTADLSGLWFTSIRNNASNLTMTGFSITREALPQLAELFTDVNIINVAESEIREQSVYNFSMVINNFRQDIPVFSPVLSVPESRFMNVEDTTETNMTEQVQTELPTSDSDEAVIDSEMASQSDTPAQTVEPVEGPPAGRSVYGLRAVDAETQTGAFAIVIHSLQSEQRAMNARDQLIDMGFKTAIWPVELENGQTTWRVGIGQFQTVVDALNSIDSLPSDIREEYFISRIL